MPIYKSILMAKAKIPYPGLIRHTPGEIRTQVFADTRR